MAIQRELSKPMHCIGVDIIEIDRIDRAATRWGGHFLERIYTDKELELCQNRPPALAARFAAKEAVMKALGTGMKGVSWKDIETLDNPEGKPIVNLHGGAQRTAEQLRLTEVEISLSHSREYAIASAIGSNDLPSQG
jgi:holo-[acyl-carrier protein] synthase